MAARNSALSPTGATLLALTFDNQTLPKAATIVRQQRSRRSLNCSSARTALTVIARVSAGSGIVGFKVLTGAIIWARGTLPRLW
jgi:hypothetical protein